MKIRRTLAALLVLVPLTVDGAEPGRVEQALSKPTQLAFVETPLRDALAFLRDLHAIAILTDDRALEALDSLEGTHLPIGYRRIELAVENLEDGALRTAWTYVKARARIDVIHSDMLAEYRLDPRYVPAAERDGWPGKTP